MIPTKSQSIKQQLQNITQSIDSIVSCSGQNDTSYFSNAANFLEVMEAYLKENESVSNDQLHETSFMSSYLKDSVQQKAARVIFAEKVRFRDFFTEFPNLIFQIIRYDLISFQKVIQEAETSFDHIFKYSSVLEISFLLFLFLEVEKLKNLLDLKANIHVLALLRNILGTLSEAQRCQSFESLLFCGQNSKREINEQKFIELLNSKMRARPKCKFQQSIENNFSFSNIARNPLSKKSNEFHFVEAADSYVESVYEKSALEEKFMEGSAVVVSSKKSFRRSSSMESLLIGSEEEAFKNINLRS